MKNTYDRTLRVRCGKKYSRKSLEFKKCFIVQIPYYSQIKMCYDFEIPEKVKEKSRKLSKEDQEIELEIEPMTISN